jgi:hypothetical protein
MLEINNWINQTKGFSSKKFICGFCDALIGSNLIHELYQTIVSFKEKIQAQAEAAKATGEMLRK